MKRLSGPHLFVTKASFWGYFLCTVAVLLLSSAASARPITYTGFTITDGQLGSWTFHNARVYLTFRSDTNNVQFMQIPDPFNPGGTIDAWINPTGTASVTVVSGGRAVHATFAPNQILVSVDLGNTGDVHVGARGVGFGSYTSTGIEPTYPLGLEDGTLDWGDIFPPGVASPALATLSNDLQHSTAFSGRAWPCVGFLNVCTAPNALLTDKGNLYLDLPYALTSNFRGDSLSAGFFIVDVGEGDEEDNQPRKQVNELTRGADSAKPITYHGYLITDVALGGHLYKRAQVDLSFDADASTAVPFSDGSHGFINATGNAHVTVTSGGHAVSASLKIGQVYVYWDIDKASVGFGSPAGGRGYPLSITANQDSFSNGLVENSSVGAVADLTLVPADSTFYSTPTAGLATDLTNETTLSGAASSCVAFDPVTSACSNFNPVALQTNLGPLYLFEPYTDDETLNGIAGPFSINWGVFWSELGRQGGDD
jgi:hypothetical protein